MKNRRRNDKDSVLYSPMHNQATEPVLTRITLPIPAHHMPKESWSQRGKRGVSNFMRAVVRKINQLLGFALAVLLLLLFTRFLLHFFVINTSVFASLVFQLTDPLTAPFEQLSPALPYSGYVIDVSTLIAIVAYTLGFTLVRQFLKVLFS